MANLPAVPNAVTAGRPDPESDFNALLAVVDGVRSALGAAIADQITAAGYGTLAELLADIPGTYVTAQVARGAGIDPTGATPSTAAVQSLVAAAAAANGGGTTLKTSTSYDPGSETSSGGMVFFPPGVYDLRDLDLSGYSNITLQGSGPSTVIINGATDGSHCIKAINADGITKNRIVIRDMLVMGNTDSGDGIHFENVDYWLVTGVHSQEHGGHGLYYKGSDSGDLSGLDDKTVSDSWFQWNGVDGMHLEETHEVLVTGVHSEENERYGLYGLDVTNLIVGDCSIEDNGVAAGYLDGCVFPQLSNTDFEGDLYIVNGLPNHNLISNCPISNLYFQSPLADLHMTNVTTTVRDCSANIVTASGGKLVFAQKVDTTQGVFDVAYSMALDCDVRTLGAAGHAIRATASSVRVTLNGHNYTNQTTGSILLVDANGQTNTRLQVGGINGRGFHLTADGVAVVNIVGNLIGGVAEWTISGDGVVTNVADNTLWSNAALEIAADRTGDIYLPRSNRLSAGSTITDASGKAISYAVSAAAVATEESTASASYADLTTAGPAVTVNVGPSGEAKVEFTAQVTPSASGVYGLVAPEVSGATTVAADDTRSALYMAHGAGTRGQASAVLVLTGLTPGANTITLKYKHANGGTASFRRRSLVVTPL